MWIYAMKKTSFVFRFVTSAILLFSSLLFVSCGYKITYDAKEAGVYDKEPESLTLEGHGFGGWYYDEEFKNPYDPEVKLTEDLTLYAKWIPEKKVTSLRCSLTTAIESRCRI